MHQIAVEASAAMDLLALHARWPDRYPFLLESVAVADSNSETSNPQAGNPQASNYWDILFALPGETIVAEEQSRDFLSRLDAAWMQAASTQNDPPVATEELPFRGGWFVYLGYELAAEVEPKLTLSAADDGLPVALATRIPAAILRDHRTGKLQVIAETADQLEALQADLAVMENKTAKQQAHTSEINKIAASGLKRPVDDDYLRMVERAKQYIHDGDIFQANLARCWQAELDADYPGDAALYAALRQANPGPFAALARFDADHCIISSSPERLVRAGASGQTDWVETRPIAGTRPRDADPEALLAHPKERAEHVMLIDLERNDLGRICEPGSIEVNEMMITESYAHVHHIVSNVRGRLRADCSPGDVIRAVFPGGTITGCPKVRCMEIIAELEPAGRGAYTGSLGYLNHDGSMDLNILIRSFVRNQQQVSVRAGAGIVADSIPEKELQETCAKARGPLAALGLTP